jgi:hypothetical protein
MRPLARIMFRYWWGFIVVAIAGFLAAPLGIVTLSYDMGYTLGFAWGCLGLLLGLSRRRLKGEPASFGEMTTHQKAGRVLLTIIGVSLFALPFAAVFWIVLNR